MARGNKVSIEVVNGEYGLEGVLILMGMVDEHYIIILIKEPF